MTLSGFDNLLLLGLGVGGRHGRPCLVIREFGRCVQPQGHAYFATSASADFRAASNSSPAFQAGIIGWVATRCPT